jgi:DNA-binding NarL/FixJ family response regulator
MLERTGVTIVGVITDGREALRCVENPRPDVIRIDIDLGADKGFDIAAQLHQRACTAAQSALIMMSAHDVRDSADTLATSPAVGAIAKNMLSARAIRAVLDKR